VTGPFWSHNQRSNRIVLTLHERQSILGQQVAKYLELGWNVVEQYHDPPQVRITNRIHQDGTRLLPAQTLVHQDRMVWVDDVGEVRVERCE